MSETAEQKNIHGTTVAVDGQGVLILGPSGSGKSALALRLLTLGATLVADDRSLLTRCGDRIEARAPGTIRGQIEARGVGILHVPTVDTAPIRLIVDLAQTSTERLPPGRQYPLLGVDLPCLRKVDHGHFPDAILLYLRHLAIQPG